MKIEVGFSQPNPTDSHVLIGNVTRTLVRIIEGLPRHETSIPDWENVWSGAIFHIDHGNRGLQVSLWMPRGTTRYGIFRNSQEKDDFKHLMLRELSSTARETHARTTAKTVRLRTSRTFRELGWFIATAPPRPSSPRAASPRHVLSSDSD